MADKPFDAAAYVDAVAMVVGLSLDPAHLPGVIFNIEQIAQMAGLLMDFPLPDDAEAAPVFTA
ncbi:MAG TPA: DUF4089 domain-containing protein [Stellaceae bacterium]|jgi:hypothetical protein|nr:DUF4089 domain-containing protein [Stellaceae bacterium]